jgi:serine/threonine protein kinase
MLAAFVFSRVARSLSYAHQTIIHRDISPENLLLNTQGVVKLSDFGVAVEQKEQGLTGKISYMSPEQVAGEAVDARTDIYSLGLVLLHAADRHLPRRRSRRDGVGGARGVRAAAQASRSCRRTGADRRARSRSPRSA